MGPAAQILAGADTLQPQILLPQVSVDTALVFELSAGDGTTTLTDQMVVTVLDLDLRPGSLGIDAGFGGELIDGGTRAVVFQGDLTWSSGLEDGTWTRAVFHAGGLGNEAKLLSGAGLYVDANGNGSYDAADRQVGDAAILAKDDGEVQFTLSEALQLGAAKRFFLVADVRQGAAGAGLCNTKSLPELRPSVIV